MKCKIKVKKNNLFHTNINSKRKILDKFNNKTNNLKKTKYTIFEIEIVNSFSKNDIILDIRSADEQNEKPLNLKGIEIISIPFYKLRNNIYNLDRNRFWLLWCEQGLMSRLQAIYLREQGFTNIKVYNNPLVFNRKTEK